MVTRYVYTFLAIFETFWTFLMTFFMIDFRHDLQKHGFSKPQLILISRKNPFQVELNLITNCLLSFFSANQVSRGDGTH